MKKSEYDIRKDFPIFDNAKFAYLDSAATSQKPKCVLDSVENFYTTSNANVHRGTYSLSQSASNLFDESRKKVKDFLNAKFEEEIIFTKNATESLNLLAYSYALSNLKPGDEIVLSILEHHSMIVPFQQIAKKCGATLKFLYLDDDYQIDDAEIESKITDKTKIVGVSSVSNVLGTITNYQKIIDKAHSVGAVAIVDISQSACHFAFDVQKTDADFVIFSGHKMFAPLGVGVLYGKKQLLENMPPFLMGGDMIEYVYEDDSTFAPLPQKFEAGTSNVASVVGLGTAIDYINSIGFDSIQEIESRLANYCLEKLKGLDFVEVYQTKNLKNHSSVISFNVKNVHPHDTASILDSQDVFVRAGNHCAQPLLRSLKLESTVRVSISIYNTKEDIDKFINKAVEIIKKHNGDVKGF